MPFGQNQAPLTAYRHRKNGLFLEARRKGKSAVYLLDRILEQAGIEEVDDTKYTEQLKTLKQKGAEE